MEKEIIVKLKREEALACCIALDRKSLQKYGWFKDALGKLDSALGFQKKNAGR